jgi:hypothetical protein
MSNTPQNPKPQTQKSEYSNQSNTGKVGNNIRKDEPTDQKKTGGMKDDACSTPGNKSSFASKPAKAS